LSRGHKPSNRPEGDSQLNAQQRDILIACLRRVEQGDRLDSVLRAYPKETRWLREHMAISSALYIVGESSPINKERARKHILSTVAHSTAPSYISSRRQFIFAVAQAALITAGVLTLMVGAAAAAELNLRSVAEQVVDTLVKPLPLSAEGRQHFVGLNAGERETGDQSASHGRPVDPAGDGGAVADDALVTSGFPHVVDPHDTNPLARGGQPSRTNPPASDTPDSNPHGNNGEPPGNGGENQEGNHGNRPGTTGPPGQNPSHSGQPGSDGHNGSNCPGNQGDINQQGQTDSNGNGSNGDKPNGSSGDASNGSNGGGSNGGGPKLSTGDAPNGSNGGASSGANSNASNEASTDHSLIFTLY